MATVGVSTIAAPSTVSVYKDAASLGFGLGWVLLWLRDNLASNCWIANKKFHCSLWRCWIPSVRL